MKKFIGIFVALMMVMLTVTPAFASENKSHTDAASISVVSQDQNHVVFNVTVDGNIGNNLTGWVSFGDGQYIETYNGSGQVECWYSKTGNFTASIWMSNKKVCSISKPINITNCSNRIYLVSSNKNKLMVGIDNYNYGWTTLNWGDESKPVDLQYGTGQNKEHDYAYKVGASQTYTLTFGTGINAVKATFTIDDKNKNYSLVASTLKPNILFWDTSKTTVTPPIPAVQPFKIGDIVILNLNTEIKDCTESNSKTINVVKDSYWFAKIVDQTTGWWKIQLADKTTGWVKESSFIFPSDLFK